MLIRVISSPHPEDTDLPWNYESQPFLNWFNEVFRESYKRDDLEPVTIEQAIEHLRSLSYVVHAPLRQATKFVKIVTVTDPDTGAQCEVEIRKEVESGALVGFDGSFLEQFDDDLVSPYGNGLLIVPDDEGEETPTVDDSQQAICPNCDKRGGLVARKDAYVNHSIPADGKIDWADDSDVSTFDHTVYECQNCEEEVELGDIEAANGFKID